MSKSKILDYISDNSIVMDITGVRGIQGIPATKIAAGKKQD